MSETGTSCRDRQGYLLPPLVTSYHSGVGRGGKLPGTRPLPPACGPPRSARGACLGAAGKAEMSLARSQPSTTELGRAGQRRACFEAGPNDQPSLRVFPSETLEPHSVPGDGTKPLSLWEPQLRGSVGEECSDQTQANRFVKRRISEGKNTWKQITTSLLSNQRDGAPGAHNRAATTRKRADYAGVTSLIKATTIIYFSVTRRRAGRRVWITRVL